MVKLPVDPYEFSRERSFMDWTRAEVDNMAAFCGAAGAPSRQETEILTQLRRAMVRAQVLTVRELGNEAGTFQRQLSLERAAADDPA